MKINRKNHKHWLYLLRSAATIAVTMPSRVFQKKNNAIILYGHKLNGNLLSIYDFIMERNSGLEVFFLTMDPAYYRQLKQDGVEVLHMGSVSDMAKVARAGAIVTDHGTHTLILYRLLTSITFVDVWHGLSYKGFDSGTFKHLHGHDEVWVQSETMKWFYINNLALRKNRSRSPGTAG